MRSVSFPEMPCNIISMAVYMYNISINIVYNYLLILEYIYSVYNIDITYIYYYYINHQFH